MEISRRPFVPPDPYEMVRLAAIRVQLNES